MFRYATVNPARAPHKSIHLSVGSFLTRHAVFRPQSTWSTWEQWRLTNTSVSAKRTASSVSLYRPRRGTRLVSADSISNPKCVEYKVTFIRLDWSCYRSCLYLQVYLCFQRMAAEILGVKLNKAEIEQSQVSHTGTRSISHFIKTFLWLVGAHYDSLSLHWTLQREHSVVNIITEVAGEICGLLSPAGVCNVTSEPKGGHRECVRSVEVTTHSKGHRVA